MSESTKHLIRAYFEQALDFSPDRRESFLLEQIEDDSVRQEVQSLLVAHDSADGFLEQSPITSDVSIDEITRWANPDETLIGERIGNCRLRRVIASGGMGTVFEAQQEDLQQRVAVKLMRRRLGTKNAQRRFEYETRVLAQLRHPGIASILEAGTHVNESVEVPYFVMEYIEDARSLTDYARHHDLSLASRLDLFLEICEAVHYGHLRGVIHRDLKPENILVDGEGRPRIIDFGVAKATDQDLAITTLVTETGQLVGTLQYMSPEQCAGDASKIDLRSDVYSLGVVLYELLCHQHPFDLTDTPPVEALRILREQNAIRPGEINHDLRGDLETIILKALAKERDRRYESVASMASDIKRYLHHEPIKARPPSGFYQLRKFARRNRTLVGAAAIIAMLLVTGIISTSVGWNRAVRAEAEAVRELTRANAVVALIDDLFSSADPHESKGPDYTVRQLLDDFEGTIGDQFEGQPLVEASIRETVGKAYLGLGLPDEAEPHLQTALDLRTQQLGENDPIALRTRRDLVSVLHDREEYAEAERRIRALLELVANDEDQALFQRSLSHSLADMIRHQERYDEAEPLLLEALETHKRNFGDEHEETLASMNKLANLYADQGRYDEAESLHLKTLEIMKRVLGDDHRRTLECMFNLASLYYNQGRYAEAEPLFVKTVEIRKRVLGDEHPYTLNSMDFLANLYMEQGRYDEAEPLLLKTLEIRKRFFGEKHKSTLGSINNLAILYMKQGRYAEAEPLYMETLEILKRLMGEEHRQTLGSMTNLGILYSRLGRIDEAESLLSRSLSIKRRVLGTRDPFTQTASSYLAMLFWDQGRLEEARTMFEELLKIKQETRGKENRHTLGTMTNLGNVYSELGLYDEAEEMLTESLSIKRRVLDPRDVFIQNAFDSLGGLYEKQGRGDEYLALNEESLALRRKTLGDEHRRTLGAITNLGKLYREHGRHAEAEALLTESVSVKRRVLGIEDQWTRIAIGQLATLYEVTDRRAEALTLRNELLDYLTEQAQSPDASMHVLNTAAWDLLTIEHTELRDPARALPLAQRAVDKVGGNNPDILDTLALAQHLTGDTAAAIETQRRAVELLPDDAGLAETLARYETALLDDEETP